MSQSNQNPFLKAVRNDVSKKKQYGFSISGKANRILEWEEYIYIVHFHERQRN